MVTLLLLAIMLVLGMGQLNAQAAQYRAVVESQSSAQALALAEAGLEDARVKLDRDGDFPPQGAEDQELFSYREVVLDLDDVTPVGAYLVTVDRRWRKANTELLRVTSEGLAGPVGAPVARRRLTLTWDLARLNRGAAGNNANFFKILHLDDEAGF